MKELCVIDVLNIKPFEIDRLLVFRTDAGLLARLQDADPACEVERRMDRFN